MQEIYSGIFYNGVQAEHFLQWVISRFRPIFLWDYRWVLNSDRDQGSAKKLSRFFTFELSDSLSVWRRPNFRLSDRWIQS